MTGPAHRVCRRGRKRHAELSQDGEPGARLCVYLLAAAFASRGLEMLREPIGEPVEGLHAEPDAGRKKLGGGAAAPSARDVS